MDIPPPESKHLSGDFSGSVFLISSAGEILKIPVPSPSLRDPLNWSHKRRVAVGAYLTALSAVSLFTVEVTSLLYEFIYREFAPTQSNMQRLVSAPTLAIGIGTFVWIPLSLALGRRPVFILGSYTLTIGALVSACAQRFSILLVGLCVVGLASGLTLSLSLLIIIDITYVDERPRWLAMFWSIPACLTLLCLSLTSVANPYLSSWRGIFVVSSVLGACIATFALVFLPESFFVRPAVAYDGRVLVQSSTEKIQIYEPWQYGEGNDVDQEQARLELRHKSFPAWSSWMCMRRPFGSSWKSMLACYPQVLLCFCNPLIFWVTAVNAINWGGMLSIGSTFAVLTKPPYSLPEPFLGFVNGSAAIGSLLAWPLTVGLATPIIQKMTLRAGGVRHAESYLIFYLLPVVAGVASLVLYGLAVANEWHFSIICLSYGFNSFSSAGMGIANTLWVTEAFPRWAAAALIVVGGASYILSFAISFSIPAWLETEGFAKMNIEIGLMLLAAGLVAVPVAFRGKSLRQSINGKWGLYEGGALRPQKKRAEDNWEEV